MVRALLPAISATRVIGVPASSSLEINVPRAVYPVIFSSIPRISQTLSGVSLTRVEKLEDDVRIDGLEPELSPRHLFRSRFKDYGIGSVHVQFAFGVVYQSLEDAKELAQSGTVTVFNAAPLQIDDERSALSIPALIFPLLWV